MVDITRQALEYIFDDFYFLFQKATLARTYINEYDSTAKTDCPGNDYYKADCGLGTSIPCKVEDLIELCNSYSLCGGFNTNGFLKTTCDHKIPCESTDTYTRKYISGKVDYDRYVEALSQSFVE